MHHLKTTPTRPKTRQPSEDPSGSSTSFEWRGQKTMTQSEAQAVAVSKSPGSPHCFGNNFRTAQSLIALGEQHSDLDERVLQFTRGPLRPEQWFTRDRKDVFAENPTNHRNVIADILVTFGGCSSIANVSKETTERTGWNPTISLGAASVMCSLTN